MTTVISHDNLNYLHSQQTRQGHSRSLSDWRQSFHMTNLIIYTANWPDKVTQWLTTVISCDKLNYLHSQLTRQGHSRSLSDWRQSFHMTNLIIYTANWPDKVTQWLTTVISCDKLNYLHSQLTRQGHSRSLSDWRQSFHMTNLIIYTANWPDKVTQGHSVTDDSHFTWQT